MLKILKTEWLKIRSYRTFWVLTILFVLCIVGINFNPPVSKMHTSSGRGADPIASVIGNPFDFPDVWQNGTFWSGFVLFIPGLLMLILITNEYNFKTHRQNIIDGTGRFEFAFGKILLVLILSVLTTIMAAVVVAATGFLKGDTPFTFDNAIYLFYFFLQAVTYILTGALFGFLLKRAGLAVSLYLIYVFLLKYILSAVFNKMYQGVGDNFPVRSADNLIPFQLMQRFGASFFHEPNIPVLLVSTFIYIAAFYIIIVGRFRKEDL